MIDTHSHIYSEEFDGDREEVIARAEAAGVSMILLPAIDSESHERQEDLAMSRPDLFRQMMGLHPTSVKEDYETELAIVHNKLFGNMVGEYVPKLNNVPLCNVPQKEQKEQKFDGMDALKDISQKELEYVAIGEIGLDFYWDTTFREEQIIVLRKQLGWAEELGLPVVLHLRSGERKAKSGEQGIGSENDAYATAFQVMETAGAADQSRSAERVFEGSFDGAFHGKKVFRGILHCFSGSLEDARKAVDMGFLLGIGGVVTYKKSTLPEIVREVGLENIVLETDAPYLSPVPYRGKRNESGYVRFVAEKVAEILGVSFDEVDAVTTENAKNLFGL